MDNEIYDYSKDIKFNINLSLKNKSYAIHFLNNLSENLGIIGNKQGKYLAHFKNISANLMLLYFNGIGEFVYYSRNNNHYKNIKRYNPNNLSIRKIVAVIKLLIKHKFIDHRGGNYKRYSKESSYRSRIRPTLKFLSLMRKNFITRKHICELDSDCIILKNAKKNLNDYKDDEYTKRIRSECLSYNSSLAYYKISLANCKPVNKYLKENDVNFNNKSYYRVFNRDFKHGGRFYGPWWLHQIPSGLRQYMLINKNKTVEYDYSSLIIHQIYSEKGLNYFEENTYSNDPYTLKDIPESQREINKAIIQIALNCRDFESLNDALIYEFKKGNLKGNKPKKEEVKKRLNIFREMNPRIYEYVYSKCALRFQYQDSEIARDVIRKCSRNLIPVLCVHDSFIVEYKNSNFIIDAMNSATKEARLTSIPLIK